MPVSSPAWCEMKMTPFLAPDRTVSRAYSKLSYSLASLTMTQPPAWSASMFCAETIAAIRDFYHGKVRAAYDTHALRVELFRDILRQLSGAGGEQGLAKIANRVRLRTNGPSGILAKGNYAGRRGS